MPEGIIVIIGAFITIFSVLAFVAWWSGFWPSYTYCLKNYDGPKSDCLTGRIQEIPPFKEAYELKDACNETDLECLAKLGEIAITEKIQDVE